MTVQLATEHIWRTNDGRYVAAGDPDARFLAAAPGDPLPPDYEKAAKRGPRPADKSVKPTGDKSATE